MFVTVVSCCCVDVRFTVLYVLGFRYCTFLNKLCLHPFNTQYFVVFIYVPVPILVASFRFIFFTSLVLFIKWCCKIINVKIFVSRNAILF